MDTTSLPNACERQLDTGNGVTFVDSGSSNTEDNRAEQEQSREMGSTGKMSTGFWTWYNCKRTILLSLYSVPLGGEFLAMIPYLF